MSNQVKHEQGSLNVSFPYTGTIAVGDLLMLDTDGKVKQPTGIAALNIAGMVITTEVDMLRCTLETPFRSENDGRIAGEDGLAPGDLYVLGPSDKCYKYSPGAVASITGTAAETFNVAEGTADAVKIKVGINGTSQTFTLTAGAARTAAQVVADINATAVGFVASATAEAKVQLSSLQIGAPLEIEAVASDAYTVLGFTAGAVDGTYPSHDPAAIRGMIKVGGDTGESLRTLDY